MPRCEKITKNILTFYQLVKAILTRWFCSLKLLIPLYFIETNKNKISTTEIYLYDIFRNDLKLSDAKAKMFAEVVNETVSNEVAHQQTEFKSGIKEDFYKVDLKIETVRNELKDVKVDLIKWFVGLFITLVIMILGLYATILLK